jgi:hypothetical protein
MNEIEVRERERRQAAAASPLSGADASCHPRSPQPWAPGPVLTEDRWTPMDAGARATNSGMSGPTATRSRPRASGAYLAASPRGGGRRPKAGAEPGLRPSEAKSPCRLSASLAPDRSLVASPSAHQEHDSRSTRLKIVSRSYSSSRPRRTQRRVVSSVRVNGVDVARCANAEVLMHT